MKVVLACLLMLPCAVVADTLRIGTNSDYPAFMFLDDTGQRIGFDKDLADIICARTGHECEWVELPIADLLDNLRSGNVDMVLGGIGYTAQRDTIVDFSCVYYDTSGNTGIYYGLAEDVNLSTARISVVRGTVHEQAIIAAGQRVVAYPDGASAIGALIDGNVQAYFGAPNYIDAYVAATGTQFRIYGEREVATTGPAIAVAEGNDALRSDLNMIISQLSQDGTLARMSRQWFQDPNHQTASNCNTNNLQS